MKLEYYNGIEIPFTLGVCHCLPKDSVLLVRRFKKPHINKWNGLGGKIEEHDTNPRTSIEREIMEEAQIDLQTATHVWYAGIVTWEVKNDKTIYRAGMYTFVADFDNESIVFEDRNTREGILGWKPLGWATDIKNPEVADNMPYFLKHMFNIKKPLHYHCTYINRVLKKVEILPLNKIRND